MRSTKVLLLVALLPALVAVPPAQARRVHRFHLMPRHMDPIRPAAKRKRQPLARTSTLATNWGCLEQTGDIPHLLSNAPQVKVVYAYPAGATDQLVTGFTYSNLIQADAAAVASKVETASGGTKSIRFDVGGVGACSSDSSNRLDIQTVALAHAASWYESGDRTFENLTDELRTALQPSDPHQRVNYVVYADGIAPTSGTVAGQADLPADQTHGYTNSINQGDDGNGHLFAVVYGYGGNDFVGGSGASERQATFLHELSHTLGAVQDNAPHSSGAGHCFDVEDIMCYDDGGPYFSNGGQLVPNNNCTGTGIDVPLDCNSDDYFKANPPSGDFLASNWNEWDSVFLCPVSECGKDLNDTNFTLSLQDDHPNGRLTLDANSYGTPIEHYEWNVNGDGVYETDTGSTPTLVPNFSFPRKSEVELRAVKADGTFRYVSMPLAPVDPTPSLKVVGDLSQPGQTLTLDGSATQDPDGLIQHFSWDTNGDGSVDTDTGTNRTVTTSYPTPGPKQATLQVDYGYGWATSAITFTINALPAPTIDGTTTPDQTGAPGFSMKPPAVSGPVLSLTRLRSKGIPLTITCGAPCTINFSLAVDPKTARKLHLKVRRGRPVVIARLHGQLGQGTTKPLLKLTATAKRALRRARSLRATLSGSVQQPPLAPLTIAKRLVFKH